MGMLLAVNAVMLVGLLFTLWRLHHLQAGQAIQRAAVHAVVHHAVKPAEPRREAAPRQSALDEFPSETGLEDPNAPAASKPCTPVAGRPLAPAIGAGRSLT